MRKLTQIEFLDIEKNEKYIDIINQVVEECFKTEDLISTKKSPTSGITFLD